MSSILSWKLDRPPQIKVNGQVSIPAFVSQPQKPQSLSGFWVASLSRYKLGKPQITIKLLGPDVVSKNYNNQPFVWQDGKLTIIVSLLGEIKDGYSTSKANVVMRGKAKLSFVQYDEMRNVIEEAVYILRNLDVR